MTGTFKTKTMVILKYPNNFLFKLKGYKCNAGYLPKVPLVTNYTAFKEMLWYTYRRELSESDIQLLALEIHDHILENKNLFEFKRKENILKEKLDTFEENNILTYYCDLSEKDMKEVYNLIHYVKSHSSKGEPLDKPTAEEPVIEPIEEISKIKMGKRLKTKEKEVSTVEVKEKAKSTETKAEKFFRKKGDRLKEVYEKLRLIRNLANTSVYDYTEEDVKAIFDELQAELDYTKRYFEDKLKNKRRRRS